MLKISYVEIEEFVYYKKMSSVEFRDKANEISKKFKMIEDKK